jgi:medium-chain acyl-[acyl-carrier-protein] hydrolase
VNQPLLAPWFVRLAANPAASLRLICIPYAGGGPQAFRTWPAMLPPNVELLAVNLPGRGRRFSETPYDRLAPLVDDLAAAFSTVTDKPLALFGHSMGALIAFELAVALTARFGIEPQRLFVSGASAPHIRDRHEFHRLPDEPFLDKVRALNGLDPEILASDELMTLLVPLLRSDFAVSETYGGPTHSRLGCPLTVFGGSNDWLVPVEDLGPWQGYSSGPFELHVIEGDHFFVHGAERAVLDVVRARLGRED